MRVHFANLPVEAKWRSYTIDIIKESVFVYESNRFVPLLFFLQQFFFSPINKGNFVSQPSLARRFSLILELGNEEFFAISPKNLLFPLWEAKIFYE